MNKEVHQLIEIAEIAMQANDYAHAEKKYIDALYLLDDPESEEYQKVVSKLAKCYAAQKKFCWSQRVSRGVVVLREKKQRFGEGS